jgi:hypothetical protein
MPNSEANELVVEWQVEEQPSAPAARQLESPDEGFGTC